MRSFEKNIKNKAGDFQLDPLPDSFDKVMQALEKKKKRRFIFWLWIIVPGITMVGTGLLISRLYPTAQMQVTAGSLVKMNHSSLLTTSDQHQVEIKTSYSTIHLSDQDNHTNNQVRNETTLLQNEQVLNLQPEIPVNNEVKEKTISNQQKEPVMAENRDHDPIKTISLTTENTRQNQITITEDKKEDTKILTGYHNQFSPLYTPVNTLFPQKNILPVSNKIIPFVKPEFSRWSIGVYSELGVCKSIFYNNIGAAGNTYTNGRKAHDEFLFSYSAGFNFRYYPVKFLAVETGVGFTHYESRQFILDASVGSSSFVQDTPDSVFLASPAVPGSKEYHNIYEYISIPLKVYYQKKWKWTGVEAGGGIVFDIPVHTKSYAADENSGISYYRTNVKDARLNMFGIQASANIHMIFHDKKFSFFVGPVFKYRLNSMFDENYMIRQHHYFIGGELGARYHF